ncbi:MAG: tetratricopeptide repeat protein [Moorea sp. SIO2B7]|nr:tetratricopeptide repeat protein [Moorena sp. SIO2B7]
MTKLIEKRYRIIKTLGSDLFGQTYLAEDTYLPNKLQCVVKQINLPNTNPKTLNLLGNILIKKVEKIKDIGRDCQIPEILNYFQKNQKFYLVEELIIGHPLTENIVPGQPLFEVQVIYLLQEVLEILVFMHNCGIIHQCIKPSNLIRRQLDGNLVLTGIGTLKEITAKAKGSQHQENNFTMNSSALYIPPEQSIAATQFNSDIYALGMIGIQAITGLEASELLSLKKSNNSKNETWNWHQGIGVSKEIIEIINKMIHNDSQKRYQLATEVLADLAKLKIKEVEIQNIIETKRKYKPEAKQEKEEINKVDLTRKHPYLKKYFWLGLGLAILLVAGSGLFVFYRKLPQMFRSKTLLNQGLEQEKTQNKQQALASYNQAISIYSKNPEAYYHRGLIYQKLGNNSAALEDFSKAIQLGSKSAEVRYYRGNLRLKWGDRQGAIVDYTEAIQLKKNYVSAYVNRGNVRADLGDEEGAMEDYTKAIEIDSNSAAAFLNRCLSRSNLNNHEGAIKDCTEAINLQPTNTFAYQNRGLAHYRLGDNIKAIDDYNTSIQIDPTEADPYYNRGLARQDLGDNLGAIADFSAAIERNPNHVFAYYDRGLAYGRIDKRKEAIADLEEASKLCLDFGRLGCYKDAQYQINKIKQ